MPENSTFGMCLTRGSLRTSIKDCFFENRQYKVTTENEIKDDSVIDLNGLQVKIAADQKIIDSSRYLYAYESFTRRILPSDIIAAIKIEKFNSKEKSEADMPIFYFRIKGIEYNENFSKGHDKQLEKESFQNYFETFKLGEIYPTTDPSYGLGGKILPDFPDNIAARFLGGELVDDLQLLNAELRDYKSKFGENSPFYISAKDVYFETKKQIELLSDDPKNVQKIAQLYKGARLAKNMLASKNAKDLSKNTIALQEFIPCLPQNKTSNCKKLIAIFLGLCGIAAIILGILGTFHTGGLSFALGLKIGGGLLSTAAAMWGAKAYSNRNSLRHKYIVC